MALGRPHHSSSGKVSSVEVVMVSVAIGLAFLFAAGIVINAINNAAFDQKFRLGEVDLNAPTIYLGTKANPTYTTADLEVVPVNVNTLRDTPRSFTVTSRCIGLDLPKDTLGIKALTAQRDVNTITITVPESPAGTVLVCTASKARTQVVLWVVTK